MFKGLLENNFEKLQNDIDQLEPKDRIKITLELAKFILPTLKSTELKTDDNFSPVNIINLGNGKPPQNDND